VAASWGGLNDLILNWALARRAAKKAGFDALSPEQLGLNEGQTLRSFLP
jgi:hypothetical protein